MYPKICHFLQELPIAMLGLAFGVCSLGWNIEKFFPLQNYLHSFTTIVALIAIFLVITKIITAKETLAQYLTSLPVAPILPTIPMSLMVTSTHFDNPSAIYVWGFALALHIFLLTSFAITRVKSFKFDNITPTWFIPTIGIVVAPLTNPSVDAAILDYWVLNFAISCYFLLLPLISLRLLLSTPLSAINKPALALYAAPPNICLTAYLTCYPNPNNLLIIILIALSIIMTLFSYYTFYRLHRHMFSPNFGAFTFPLIIGAAAMQATADFFESNFAATLVIQIFSSLALLQIILATWVTLFVCYRYVLHFSGSKKYQ